MSLIRDNFIKLFIIYVFNTKLTTFFNMYENDKTTYYKTRREAGNKERDY